MIKLNLPYATKIDDIIIIKKVYPYDDNQIMNQENNHIVSYEEISYRYGNRETNIISNCKKNIGILCKCQIYIIGCILCIPCITTNICINISFNLIRCICICKCECK